jgi:glycosyltransferase involved in cell wall biosynthesis
MAETTLVHLTTVHPRSDTRIFVKEARTLAASLPHRVMLLVADGLGDLEPSPGGVAVRDLGDPGPRRLNRLLQGSLKALEAIAQIKPDVVHFHDPELIPVGLLLRLKGHKVIYDVHEDVPRQILTKYWVPVFVRHPLAWMMSAAEWLGSRLFTAVVSATPTIADRFPDHKTTTIYNYPLLAEMATSKSVPYQDRQPSFAYVGVIEDVRGITEIVEALEGLGDVEGVSLELAGQFAPASYQHTLRGLNGWRAVHYCGYLSRAEVGDILGRVRAGLVIHHPIPNEIDALPIKLFEYMSAGLPVIASDFPPIRAIVEGTGCGLLVDPLDRADITRAMRWVVEHPREAEAMGERGRQAVHSVYNWNTEAVKIVDLYRRILAVA